MVAATVRFDVPKSGKKSARKSKGEGGRQDACPTNARQPWMPSERERIIFRWVKFDGEKQSEVAHRFGINQSTVSRIVQRYERWIARGGEQQEGAPSHEERLRAQKWLTYERNEWILCSALRIAAEMERHYEASKSTIKSDSLSHSGQREVRTENKVIDRTGIAARFLRLAYRINMDQLRLVEEEPLPALEPLSVEDAEATAVADAAEMKAAEEKAVRQAEVAGRSEGETEGRSHEDAVSVHPRINDQAPMTNEGVHKMHNDAGAESDLNADRTSPSGQNGRAKKSAAYAFPADSEPEGKDGSNGRAAKNRPADGRRLTLRVPILTG